MTRAPIVLLATAAGVAAVLSFQPRRQEADGTRTTTSAPARAGASTVLGSAETTPYGPVQVRITVRGGKVTEIAAVQVPQNDPHSAQISTEVEPLLREQALTAQSASIDGVSGATYTSDGYRASLAAALAEAGL